jgi:hypothetical protein
MRKALNLGEVMRITCSHGLITVRSVSVPVLISVAM